MNVTTKLAWRNVFRNRRRTFFTGTAIAVGLAALIFIDAAYLGEADNLIESATGAFSGEGQIHAADYLRTRDINKTVAGLDDIVARLKRDVRVKAFTLRTLSQAVMASPAGVRPILLAGVQFDTEKNLSLMDEGLVRGAYPAGNDPQAVLIGVRLSELLDVGVGDRVVITVSRAADGGLAQDLFRISGIFRTASEDLDGSLVHIPLDRAQALMDLGDRVHEIALSFKNRRLSGDPEHPFWRDYAVQRNEASGWTELYPALKSLYGLALLGLFIVGLILFGVVALVIVNTLFMSIHERLYELGVLRALGTRPSGILGLVLREAGVLALLSVLLGMALGFLSASAASRIGLDYRGVEFGGVTIRALIYPVLQIRQFLLYPALIFLLTLCLALYPAVHAARMSVAGAVKRGQ